MPKNIQSIQFMRFVAAILVVFYHTAQAVRNNLGGLSNNFVYFTEIGASGVHIFFVISGFIVTYTSFFTSMDDFAQGRFFIKRFARIYPTYWIYCVLYVVFHYNFGHEYRLSVTEIIGTSILLPGFSYMIIGPGWTLAYEVYFYVCFGLIMPLGLRRGFVAISALFVISVFVGGIFHFHSLLLTFFTNSLLIEFLCGSAIAYLLLLLKNKNVPERISFAMQAAAICVFILTYFAGYRRLPTFLTWGIPSALLIAGLALNEHRGIIWPTVRKFAFLGDSSYSLYLIHILVIDVFLLIYDEFNIPRPGSWSILLCVLFTSVSAALAILLYHLVERNSAYWLAKFIEGSALKKMAFFDSET